MNINPTLSTLQAFGTTLKPTVPASQARLPAAVDQAQRPTPNGTQRADAAPRTEAPAKPQPAERNAPSVPADRATGRAARIDILV